MNLNFIKIKDRWVAEFKTSGPFNLHIEGVVEGNVSLFHKTIENGNYAYLRGSTPSPASFSKVYDADFTALVYPKFIKVTCATEPKTATVTAIEETTIIEVIPDSVDFTFNLPMEEIDGAVNGTIEGEFTGTYNTVAAFAKGNGVAEDYGYSVKDSSDVDIKVNGYKVGDVEYHETEEFIKMQTDALSNADADGSAVLRKESLSFAYALPKEEPDTPSEPEVLTYEFNIPMVEDYDSLYGETYYSGVINAEFGDIYNKIDALAKAFGEDLGYQWYLDNDKTLEKTNISVNGYRITYIESNTDGRIVLGIGGVFVLGGDAQAWMSTTSIQVDLPQPWNPNAPKPESDVIEYHFEIPMEEDGFFIEPAYYGTLEGDFSKEYSAIVALSEKIGVFKNGFYTITEGGSPLTNPKITVNGFNVTEIRSAPSYERIEFSTDAPYNGSSSGDGTITKTAIDFSAAEPHAPKPESDVIEYNFSIPLKYEDYFMGGGYAGEVEGDFSDICSKLTALTETYGKDNSIEGDALAERAKITLNNQDTVIYCSIEEDSSLYLKLDVDGPLGQESYISLSNTRAYCERGTQPEPQL